MKHYIKVLLSGLLISAMPIPVISKAMAEYQAQDFFVHSDLDMIAGVEPISQEIKDSIIQSGFTNSDEKLDEFRAFAPLTNTPHLFALTQVKINVLPHSEGGNIVIVTSTLGSSGSGPVHSQTFYRVDHQGKIGKQLTAEELGLSDILRNEFYAKENHYPKNQNDPLMQYTDDDGSIYSEPNTWMVPESEIKEMAQRVRFVWTGKQFEKKVTPLPPGVKYWFQPE